MDLYKRLVEIFEIDQLNLDKSNRRTLNKYLKRTKLQQRREAFYSVCSEGTKSKVAICKDQERPTWVHNLTTLKTKQLRVQIKDFLKKLGILVDPKYANLKRLAKEKNWLQVAMLGDPSKSGGMPMQDDPTSPVSGRNRRGRVHAGTPVPARVGPGGGRYAGLVSPRRVRTEAQLDAALDTADEDWDPDADAARASANLRGNASFQSTLPFGEDGNPVSTNYARATASRRVLSAEERDAAFANHPGVQHARSLLAEQDEKKKQESMHGETEEELKRLLLRREHVKLLDAGSGGGDDSGVEVLKTGRDCFWMDEEEECTACPRNWWSRKAMSKSTQKKLKGLAEKKALTCAKIDLLKCITVEHEKQAKLWQKFQLNPEGDFLAPFNEDRIKELMVGKDTVFDARELHTLRGVAQCVNLSQNLLKGYGDSMLRFNKGKIRDGYSMGHLGYDELLANVRKFGDEWSLAALKARYPDPVNKRTLICSESTSMIEVPDKRAELNPGVLGLGQAGPSRAVDGDSRSGTGAETKTNIHVGGSRLRGGDGGDMAMDTRQDTQQQTRQEQDHTATAPPAFAPAPVQGAPTYHAPVYHAPPPVQPAVVHQLPPPRPIREVSMPDVESVKSEHTSDDTMSDRRPQDWSCVRAGSYIQNLIAGTADQEVSRSFWQYMRQFKTAFDVDSQLRKYRRHIWVWLKDRSSRPAEAEPKLRFFLTVFMAVCNKRPIPRFATDTKDPCELILAMFRYAQERFLFEDEWITLSRLLREHVSGLEILEPEVELLKRDGYFPLTYFDSFLEDVRDHCDLQVGHTSGHESPKPDPVDPPKPDPPKGKKKKPRWGWQEDWISPAETPPTPPGPPGKKKRKRKKKKGGHGRLARISAICEFLRSILETGIFPSDVDTIKFIGYLSALIRNTAGRSSYSYIQQFVQLVLDGRAPEARRGASYLVTLVEQACDGTQLLPFWLAPLTSSNCAELERIVVQMRTNTADVYDIAGLVVPMAVHHNDANPGFVNALFPRIMSMFLDELQQFEIGPHLSVMCQIQHAEPDWSQTPYCEKANQAILAAHNATLTSGSELWIHLEEVLNKIRSEQPQTARVIREFRRLLGAGFVKSLNRTQYERMLLFIANHCREPGLVSAPSANPPSLPPDEKEPGDGPHGGTAPGGGAPGGGAPGGGAAGGGAAGGGAAGGGPAPDAGGGADPGGGAAGGGPAPDAGGDPAAGMSSAEVSAMSGPDEDPNRGRDPTRDDFRGHGWGNIGPMERAMSCRYLREVGAQPFPLSEVGHTRFMGVLESLALWGGELYPKVVASKVGKNEQQDNDSRALLNACIARMCDTYESVASNPDEWKRYTELKERLGKAIVPIHAMFTPAQFADLTTDELAKWEQVQESRFYHANQVGVFSQLTPNVGPQFPHDPLRIPGLQLGQIMRELPSDGTEIGPSELRDRFLVDGMMHFAVEPSSVNNAKRRELYRILQSQHSHYPHLGDLQHWINATPAPAGEVTRDSFEHAMDFVAWHVLEDSPDRDRGDSADRYPTPEELSFQALRNAVDLRGEWNPMGDYGYSAHWMQHPRHVNWLGLAASGYWHYRNIQRSDLARKFMRELMLARHGKETHHRWDKELGKLYGLASQRADVTTQIKKEPSWAAFNYADMNESLLPTNPYSFPMEMHHMTPNWDAGVVENLMALKVYLGKALYQGKKFPDEMWESVEQFLVKLTNLSQEAQEQQFGDPDAADDDGFDDSQFPPDEFTEAEARLHAKNLKEAQGVTMSPGLYHTGDLRRAMAFVNQFTADVPVQQTYFNGQTFLQAMADTSTGPWHGTGPAIGETGRQRVAHYRWEGSEDRPDTWVYKDQAPGLFHSAPRVDQWHGPLTGNILHKFNDLLWSQRDKGSMSDAGLEQVAKMMKRLGRKWQWFNEDQAALWGFTRQLIHLLKMPADPAKKREIKRVTEEFDQMIAWAEVDAERGSSKLNPISIEDDYDADRPSKMCTRILDTLTLGLTTDMYSADTGKMLRMFTRATEHHPGGVQAVMTFRKILSFFTNQQGLTTELKPGERNWRGWNERIAPVVHGLYKWCDPSTGPLTYRTTDERVKERLKPRCQRQLKKLLARAGRQNFATWVTGDSSEKWFLTFAKNWAAKKYKDDKPQLDAQLKKFRLALAQPGPTGEHAGWSEAVYKRYKPFAQFCGIVDNDPPPVQPIAPGGGDPPILDGWLGDEAYPTGNISAMSEKQKCALLAAYVYFAATKWQYPKWDDAKKARFRELHTWFSSLAPLTGQMPKQFMNLVNGVLNAASWGYLGMKIWQQCHGATPLPPPSTIQQPDGHAIGPDKYPEGYEPPASDSSMDEPDEPAAPCAETVQEMIDGFTQDQMWISTPAGQAWDDKMTRLFKDDPNEEELDDKLGDLSNLLFDQANLQTDEFKDLVKYFMDWCATKQGVPPNTGEREEKDPGDEKEPPVTGSGQPFGPAGGGPAAGGAAPAGGGGAAPVLPGPNAPSGLPPLEEPGNPFHGQMPAMPPRPPTPPPTGGQAGQHTAEEKASYDAFIAQTQTQKKAFEDWRRAIELQIIATKDHPNAYALQQLYLGQIRAGPPSSVYTNASVPVVQKPDPNYQLPQYYGFMMSGPPANPVDASAHPPPVPPADPNAPFQFGGHSSGVVPGFSDFVVGSAPVVGPASRIRGGGHLPPTPDSGTPPIPPPTTPDQPPRVPPLTPAQQAHVSGADTLSDLATSACDSFLQFLMRQPPKTPGNEKLLKQGALALHAKFPSRQAELSRLLNLSQTDWATAMGVMRALVTQLCRPSGLPGGPTPAAQPPPAPPVRPLFGPPRSAAQPDTRGEVCQWFMVYLEHLPATSTWESSKPVFLAGMRQVVQKSPDLRSRIEAIAALAAQDFYAARTQLLQLLRTVCGVKLEPREPKREPVKREDPPPVPPPVPRPETLEPVETLQGTPSKAHLEQYFKLGGKHDIETQRTADWISKNRDKVRDVLGRPLTPTEKDKLERPWQRTGETQIAEMRQMRGEVRRKIAKLKGVLQNYGRIPTDKRLRTEKLLRDHEQELLEYDRLISQPGTKPKQWKWSGGTTGGTIPDKPVPQPAPLRRSRAEQEEDQKAQAAVWSTSEKDTDVDVQRVLEIEGFRARDNWHSENYPERYNPNWLPAQKKQRVTRMKPIVRQLRRWVKMEKGLLEFEQGHVKVPKNKRNEWADQLQTILDNGRTVVGNKAVAKMTRKLKNYIRGSFLQITGDDGTIRRKKLELRGRAGTPLASFADELPGVIAHVRRGDPIGRREAELIGLMGGFSFPEEQQYMAPFTRKGQLRKAEKTLAAAEHRLDQLKGGLVSGVQRSRALVVREREPDPERQPKRRRMSEHGMRHMTLPEYQQVPQRKRKAKDADAVSSGEERAAHKKRSKSAKKPKKADRRPDIGGAGPYGRGRGRR